MQEANQTTFLHDYVLFNVRAGVTWKQYDLTGFVNNAGQESYLVFHAPSACLICSSTFSAFASAPPPMRK